MNIRKKLIFLNIMCLLCLFSSGCSQIDNAQVKLGFKNRDFEYVKNERIQKVVIQNTRDKGFRFVVTDKRAIDEIYDILSSAKVVSQKTSLQSDYSIEIYQNSSKIHRFDYVTGLNKKGTGNLYSDNKIYYVSDRLDNDILKNFKQIRSPKNFKEVYYQSIIKVLEEYTKGIDSSKKIGVKISDDVEIAKFVFSIDLEDFKISLKDKFSNVELMEDLNKDYDVVVNIKTDGYKRSYGKKDATYKCSAIVNDFNDNSEKKYYVWNKYISSNWETTVYKDKKPPQY